MAVWGAEKIDPKKGNSRQEVASAVSRGYVKVESILAARHKDHFIKVRRLAIDKTDAKFALDEEAYFEGATPLEDWNCPAWQPQPPYATSAYAQ